MIAQTCKSQNQEVSKIAACRPSFLEEINDNPKVISLIGVELFLGFLNETVAAQATPPSGKLRGRPFRLCPHWNSEGTMQ